MKYCSECGAAISRQWMPLEGRERNVCQRCGTTHYENPSVIVGCIASWGDKVLLCRRSQEPARGKWALPSGFLECGETLEQGASRETFEETGVNIAPCDFELYCIMSIPAISQVSITFRATLNAEPVICAGPECLEAGFMSEEQISCEQLAWSESTCGELKSFFKELRSGQFKIHLATVDANRAAAHVTRK
jgi:ADP-ribose pyrophosphatase YjhB (NUDIX family)